MKPQLNLDNLTHYRGWRIERHAKGVTCHMDGCGESRAMFSTDTVENAVKRIDKLSDESDGE
jgi:hypothetical protein